jgi:hypothetical protein
MMKRDENGRFAVGNGGGPGRPPKKREMRYYEITMTSCTYDDWKKIVMTAVAQAKRGDNLARKWLSDYLVGEPDKNLNITGALQIAGLQQALEQVYGDDDDNDNGGTG